MGVRHEQLVSIGGREGAAKRADPLSGKRRAGGGREPAIAADAEPIQIRRSGIWTDSGRDESAAVRADQDMSRQRVVGDAERRPADRTEMSAGIEAEPGVV